LYNFYARELTQLAIARINYGNSGLVSVRLSVCPSRPGTNPSPGKIEASGFHLETFSIS